MNKHHRSIFFRPAAAGLTTFMADTAARAAMGATTSGGQAIDFDGGSCVLANIDNSLWISNTSTPASNNSYRVNEGNHSTMTWDFDVNPGTGTNFLNLNIGLRSDGTLGNYVCIRFDGFGHLQLLQVVAAAVTQLGTNSALSIDNTGATTYHIQVKVDASNNWTTKVNGSADANLAGNSASFATGPYFHIVMSTGAMIANTGVKNIVVTN